MLLDKYAAPTWTKEPRSRRAPYGCPGVVSSGLVNDQCEWIVRHLPSIRRNSSVEFQRAAGFSEPSGCRS